MSISGDSPSTISSASSSRRPTGRLQRLLVAVSVVLAVVALALAATSIVIALQTAGEVDAMTARDGGGGGSEPGAKPTIEASATPDGPEPSGPPDGVPSVDPTAQPTLDAQTQYAIHYPQQLLTLRVSGNNTSMHADLDEPRADVPSSEADITLRASYGNPQANLVLGRDVRGSKVDGPGLTPHDCSEQIRMAPLGAEAQVPVQQGVVLCLWTSRAAAVNSGRAQLVVLLEITGDSPDGDVSLRMDAWKIPG
ncbi:hypothetical protein O7632_20790 [Solwaraspora sp. WMMD406]|uniref:hypothetical protein n=1 Tax=Solwaraspora sp. WMMD406 TaxID=3016095 RepID=UPI0024162084|nr:hypothetical protein [Solwaraspora sp. WMMD406]MDG4766515.1 hypothetical protein [Solwaraspora sp. WMMD406]